MHKNAYIHFKMYLCHHSADQTLRLRANQKLRGKDPGTRGLGIAGRAFSMPCSSTVAHWGSYLVFQTGGFPGLMSGCLTVASTDV